ncbi:hypothetical protein D3C72_1343360 [compost metagenome]
MHQIQGAVAEFDVHPQLRMARHEFIDQGNDEALAVGHGAGHAQHALGFAGQVAHRAQGFLAGIEKALAMLQEGLPGLGQGHLARAAVEQAGLQAFFEPGDLAADMGRRNAQALGGGGELARFGHCNEFVQAFPATHGLSLSSNKHLR